MNPDKWLLLKQSGESRADSKDTVRVFATWAGGYTTGDSWRLNSGTDVVTEDEEFYYVKGKNSETSYKLHKESEGIAGASNYYQLEAFEEHGLTHLPREEAEKYLKEQLK